MIIEEAELRNSARRLLSGVGKLGDAQAWQAMVEAGWPALTAPESLGGLDQPMAVACWLYAELGRALSPAPLLASLLAIATLRACPNSPERDDWTLRIAGGERIAISLLEPQGSAHAPRKLRAVIGAEAASQVLAVMPDEPRIALLPLHVQGTQVTPTATWDATRKLCDIGLAGAGAGHTLASGPDAAVAASALSTHLHFAIAADCIGAADAVLEQTVLYLKARRQFDRPLALFQALKHRCADLKVTIQAADALLADYLRDIEGDTVHESNRRALGAKSMASLAFRATAEDAVQLMGGMGMTMEHPCHLFLKRALLNEQLATGNDACDVVVGRGLVLAERT